jgi:hypothetical protein
MKQSLLFSLKVFLTTVVIGPILLEICLIIKDSQVNNFNSPITFLYTMIIGAVVCIPAWFLFGVSVQALRGKQISLGVEKILLILIGACLLVLTLAITNYNYLIKPNYWPSVFPLLGSYYIILIIATSIYTLPSPSGGSVSK